MLNPELKCRNLNNNISEIPVTISAFIIGILVIPMIRERSFGERPIIAIQVKVPIIVEDTNNLIVFPTTSPHSSDCSWISLKRIHNIYKIDANNTKIVFDNQREIIVPCSFRSIENQISRASRLDLILRNHKNS